MIYTKEQFLAEWQKCHHPDMDLRSDAAFYYGVYCRLWQLAGESAKYLHSSLVMSLTMYVENMASIGLDGEYERLYRNFDDAVRHWTEIMSVSSDTYARMYQAVTEAVAQAPRSSLLAWIVEGVGSRDFHRLQEVAHFFAFHDNTLSVIYFAPQIIEKAFMRLPGVDEGKAWQMIWAHLAFNWQDKQGMTILQRIGNLLLRSPYAKEAAFSFPAEQLAANLQSLQTDRLEAYLPQASKDNHTLTLTDNHGNTFQGVVFDAPLPTGYQYKCFVGQLVTYLGTTYVNGVGLWLPRKAFDQYDFPQMWQDIKDAEREEALFTTFTTAFGNEVPYYEDLYPAEDNPESEEDTYYSDQGIYLDELNILDFLKWK